MLYEIRNGYTNLLTFTLPNLNDRRAQLTREWNNGLTEIISRREHVRKVRKTAPRRNPEVTPNNQVPGQPNLNQQLVAANARAAELGQPQINQNQHNMANLVDNTKVLLEDITNFLAEFDKLIEQAKSLSDLSPQEERVRDGMVAVMQKSILPRQSIKDLELIIRRGAGFVRSNSIIALQQDPTTDLFEKFSDMAMSASN